MSKVDILWGCFFAALIGSFIGSFIGNMPGALLGVGAVMIVTLKDWWPL
jgi:hypothetical protein